MVRTEVARSTPWFVASTCVAMQMRVVLLLLMSAGRGDGIKVKVSNLRAQWTSLRNAAPSARSGATSAASSEYGNWLFGGYGERVDRDGRVTRSIPGPRKGRTQGCFNDTSNGVFGN